MNESKQPEQAANLLWETDPILPSTQIPLTQLPVSSTPITAPGTAYEYPRPKLLILVLIAVVALGISMIGLGLQGWIALKQMLTHLRTKLTLPPI